MKKFELTGEQKHCCGITLFRIKALKSFSDVVVGQTGGWVEKEENLSQDGDAWIIGNAVVSYNTDYVLISGFGTEFRTTTFFRCDDDNIRVSCGCFFGTIPQFIEQVKNTRSVKIAEEYLAIAELMEKHFEKGDSDDTSI